MKICHCQIFKLQLEDIKKSVLRLYKLVPTFIEFARQASNMFWYRPLFKKMIVRPASERITDTCRDTA